MEQPRQSEASVWTGEQLLVWGGIGEGGTIPTHGEAYDPATNEWTPLPRSPLRARLPGSVVWTGSEVLIWGGQDARTDWDGTSPWIFFSDGAALTPAS
jgi:hypothetical protein